MSVSTLADSKLLIRAVLLGDHTLLKSFLADQDRMCSVSARPFFLRSCATVVFVGNTNCSKKALGSGEVRHFVVASSFASVAPSSSCGAVGAGPQCGCETECSRLQRHPRGLPLHAPSPGYHPRAAGSSPDQHPTLRERPRQLQVIKKTSASWPCERLQGHRKQIAVLPPSSFEFCAICAVLCKTLRNLVHLCL